MHDSFWLKKKKSQGRQGKPCNQYETFLLEPYYLSTDSYDGGLRLHPVTHDLHCRQHVFSLDNLNSLL